MSPPGPVEPAESKRAPRGGGKPASLFVCVCFALQEPDMLQDIPTPALREASPCVLETERLTLRGPTLADVKAIAHLANDRRVAENTRRLPHPYSQDHGIEFVRAIADNKRETVFLIENNFVPIGMVGVDWRHPDAPKLGYWLGVEHWGRGFATEAARAVIDFTFEEFGVELHRFEALGSSTPVDCFRLSRGVWSSLKNWNSSTRHER